MTDSQVPKGDETLAVQQVAAGERLEIRIVRAGAADSSNHSRLRRDATPLVKWLAGTVSTLLIGAVVGAFVSDRFSDRQRELELESDLVKQISRDAIVLFQDAQDASRADSSATQREQREQAADAWVLASGSITPLFRVYYDSQPVSVEWDEYQAAMYAWAKVGCCTSGEEREPFITELRSYHEQRLGLRRAPPVQDPWAALNTTDPPQNVYQWLGLELLRGRGLLLDELQESSPSLD